jgi:carbonic anhydrase
MPAGVVITSDRRGAANDVDDAVEKGRGACDVRRIIESPIISKQIEVSGYSYDVKTGRLAEVVGPTRARTRS